ncbi:MAG TPA: lipid-A-disaccharide synthase [Candidatus Binatia bacterium]|nr:lipid-A-disaccharide synthase [Candidatus Binatia bacterium]
MTVTSPLVVLVAGEPSGDALGAPLMRALRTEAGGDVRFAGVGGERMASEGLRSLFPMSDLAVMGLVSVLPHVPRILRRLRETAAHVLALRPAAVVTIDSPGFNLRLARRLRGRGIPLVHYVAPTVWAWKPGRARTIARFLDRLLVLFPFEPPYFERHGLACDFVGHPAVEAAAGDAEAFRRRHAIPAAVPLLCAMPGSRRDELDRLLPIYGETVSRLRARVPELRVVVPAVTWLEPAIQAAIAGWGKTIAVRGSADKLDAFAAADVGLVKSGTGALEAAVAGLPCVVTQRFGPVSAWMARRLLRVRHVSLVNILLQREVQPERLQEDCNPTALSAALTDLLADPDARQRQRDLGRRAAEMVGLGGPPPSRRAAHAILRLTHPQR